MNFSLQSTMKAENRGLSVEFLRYMYLKSMQSFCWNRKIKIQQESYEIHTKKCFGSCNCYIFNYMLYYSNEYVLIYWLKVEFHCCFNNDSKKMKKCRPSVSPSSLAKSFAHGPFSLHPWQIELDFWIHALSISISCVQSIRR